MKSTPSKAAVAQSKTNEPFFSKGNGRGFFGQSNNKSSSFFSPSKNGCIQAKLNVGKPNDQYEKEADAVADRVVQKMSASERATPGENVVQPKPITNAITPIVHRKCAECEQEEKLQKKEEEMNEEIPLQRKPIFESNAEPEEDKHLQRKCEACENDEEKVQRKEGDAAEGSASSNIEDQLNKSKGNGAPLPADVNHSMSNAFGRDFSDVRVHTDSTAEKMSSDLNAQAFTHGSDVYFNQGKYDTGSTSGRHLLAHELTHTIQQGGAGLSRKEKSIQRAAKKKKKKEEKEITKDDVIADILGPKYIIIFKTSGLKYTLDVTAKELTMPGISLPDFKKRNEPKYIFPILSLRGRGVTEQSDNWKNAVKSAVNAKVSAFLEDKKSNEQGFYFFRLKKDDNFHIIGTKEQIQDACYIPKWNRQGKPNTHQVDHIVEHQLGGEDQASTKPQNYELLDAKANMSSGNSIKLERFARIRKAIGYFGDLNKETPPLFPKLPSEEDIKKGYINKFEKVDQWNLGYKGKGNIYWEYPEVLAGKQLNHLEEIPAKDIAKIQGKDNEALIYLGESAGTPKRLKLPPNGGAVDQITDFYKGLDLTGTSLTTITDKDANAKIQFKLNKKFSKRLKADKQLEFDLVRLPGRINTFYIKTTREFNKNMFKKFEGMSPVTLDQLTIDSSYGLTLTGMIEPDLPLFKGLSIDFFISAGEMGFTATIPLSVLAKNFPKLFNVSDANLQIEYTSTNDAISLQGNIKFAIEKIGEGEIQATRKGKGFRIAGNFIFDKSKFDGQLRLVYDNETGWEIGGTAKIGPDKIKGVKDAVISFDYAKDVIVLSGSANVTVPGLKAVKINSTIGKEGNFEVIAEAELGQIPGIKGGRVKLIIRAKKGEDITLGAAGKAIPDFAKVPNLQSEIDFLYDNGLFDVKAQVKYKKGRFDGTVELGLTNRQVDDKGKPQGEPVETGEVVAYGFGSLTVDLFKGNTGTVSVRLTPERDLLVAGEIELKNLSPFGDGYNFEKEILKFPRIVIPLAGIPGVSISAFIDGGVFFKFSWQPLILKQLKVGFAETNINEIENVTLDIHGSVGSMASAEVYMTINAGLEARVLVATLSGAIGGEAGLGISAEAGGDLDASWNMEKGLQFKEVRAFLNVTPKAVFRLTGSISIDLDLWITTVNLYYHKWVFAEKELDLSGLTLKLDFPIRFNEDNTVKMPSYEEMNVQKPDFTGAQGEAILDKAINGDAEKELEAKKQEIRSQIQDDMRKKSYDPEFSLSDYTEKMVEKYGKSEELKEFVLRTIEDESRRLEYERFERNKSMIRSSAMPLSGKLTLLNIFSMFNQYVTNNDVEAFKAELITIEEEKIKAQQAPVDNLQNPNGNAAVMGPPPPPDNQSVTTNGVAQKNQISNGANGATKLQRKPIFESDTEPTKEESIQSKCAECEKEEQIQKKEITDEGNTSDELMGDTEHLDDPDADIQREPDTDSAPAEPLPFSPDPKNEILPPKPTPGTTQTPDRSDTLSVKGLWWFHRQPIEEATKKLHPERRFEYEDSIFFDYDSASLPDIEKQLKIDRDNTDPKKPGGWLGRADSHKIKITLRGNASEEGNPAYNLSLSKKRMKAVADALKHPNIIIVKQESIFGKDKTVDFRRARRVDIVEEGVSSPAVSPGDCKETLKKIMSVKSRSITFLDKASLNILKAMKSPSDKESAKTRGIVAKWFNKSDVGTMSAVADGVSQISKTLQAIDPSKGNLTCEVTGKPPVQNCSEGVGARGGNEPKAHLIVCSSMEKSDNNKLTELFIHEAGHAAGFMKDFAYTYERVFRVIDTASKLKMPDGYVATTLEINSVLENADVEVPSLGKDDKVKCLGEQGKLAMNALGLVDRWIEDAQTSVRELYDKSHPDFLADHVATVRTHFDPGYDDKKIKVTEALYARFEELSFPLRGDLEVICINDLKDISDLGGFWQQDSSGFPGDKIFLFQEFFTKAKDAEKGALLLTEMLAKASGFIEVKHRKAFAKMAQSFNKTQDKNPWRKK